MNLAMLATDWKSCPLMIWKGVPCTAGGERAVRYLQSRMEETGWSRPLAGAICRKFRYQDPPRPIRACGYHDKKGVLRYANGTEISLWSPMLSPEVSLTNNEIVFVGFESMRPNITGMIFENRCKGENNHGVGQRPWIFTQDLRFSTA